MLTRWGYRVPDFFGEMNRLSREMNRWCGEAGSNECCGVFPPLNVYDDGESIVVRAEIPGMDPKSIEVNAAARSLTIQGERPRTAGAEQQSFHRKERGYGKFSRSLTLPQEINPDKVRAEYRLGVLEVVLPKSEENKPRKIEIHQA
jgi:HSP20 family protein